MAKEEKKAPKLRFNGYTNDWERKKLGIYVPITMGQSPNSKNYTNNPRDNILVQGNADLYNNRVLKRTFTTEVTKIADRNDILISVRAPVGDIARNQYESIVIGRGIAAIKGNNFLYYQLEKMNNSGFWKKYIAGSTFESITGKDLKSSDIYISNHKEEKSIGDIFQTLTKTIQLHERKCEELTLIKQALLQKLFPKKDEIKPEVRYENFSDAWEQRKLGEIGKVFTGNTPSTKNTENWTTDKSIGHVWITPTDINNNIMFDSERYLSDKGWSQARVVPKNSVLITSIASIGKNAINGVEVAFNQQINALVVQKNNPYFILTLMNKEKQRFESLAGQTATPIINKSTFSSFMVKIPSETEQKQIGDFFKQLDSLIALHQRKLEKLKQLKKFLLQNMFI